MLKDNTRNVFFILLMLLELSSSGETIDHNNINSELYRTYLSGALIPLRKVEKAEKFSPIDRMKYENTKDNETTETTYETVIRNLRSNWEMPVNYLKQRGYLANVGNIPNNDLSMDAYNLINGPLLNPIMYKNLYPLPHGPNLLQTIKTERSDKSNKEFSGVSNGAKIRSYNEIDCNDPNMFKNIACLDQYLGENWIKSAKDKWNSWFNKNDTIAKNETVATNESLTTSTTTTSSPILSTNPPNITSEVISDLSLQDANARDSLEFFKIYNDFMLAKLAAKLNENALHERRMSNDIENSKQNNQIPTQASLLPDFSRINDNDINILKNLDSCLKNKKLTKLDTPDIDETNDVSADAQAPKAYLQTKLKFLAHLHHDVVNIGQILPLSKDQSNQRDSDSNVDITLPGISR